MPPVLIFFIPNYQLKALLLRGSSLASDNTMCISLTDEVDGIELVDCLGQELSLQVTRALVDSSPHNSLDPVRPASYRSFGQRAHRLQNMDCAHLRHQ